MNRQPPDRLADAARLAARRMHTDSHGLARRLGQIGVLGWLVVLPLLGGIAVGRWIDRRLDSGVMFSGALLMAGATLGMWLGWRWMHRDGQDGP